MSSINDDSKFIEVTAKNVGRFLEPYIPRIEQYYDWPFATDPARELLGYGFEKEPNEYQKTVKLKKLLVAGIQKCDDFEETLKLGKYFVEDWGKVRRNRELAEKLRPFYVEKDRPLARSNSIKKIEGISSWSKYLSLLRKDAAIYDSRVAYALNAINFLYGNVEYFFPVPEGQSRKLKIVSIETLFVVSKIKTQADSYSEEDFSHRQFAARVRRRLHIKEALTYRRYLDVLKRAGNELHLDLTDQHKIEMLLFALAPNKVLSALLDHLKAQR